MLDGAADLYRRLPEARITDILIEVDDATGRTSCGWRPPWRPGTLRPSQLLRKLAAYPRQNELAAALRESAASNAPCS